MPCVRCGTGQTDPPPGKPSPWVRAVIGGEQVLVCPSCQTEDPATLASAERCPRCGGARLQVQLGLIVCRACGHDWDRA